MRTEFDELVENQQIGLSLLSDDTKCSIEELEEACHEFREMILSKNPAKDDLFAGLPRVKATIIVNALALVESEDWQKIKSIIALQE